MSNYEPLYLNLCFFCYLCLKVISFVLWSTIKFLHPQKVTSCEAYSNMVHKEIKGTAALLKHNIFDNPLTKRHRLLPFHLDMGQPWWLLSKEQNETEVMLCDIQGQAKYGGGASTWLSLSFWIFTLRTQPPCCEELKPHEEAKWRFASQQSCLAPQVKFSINHQVYK